MKGKLAAGVLVVAAWIGGYGYGRWYGPGVGGGRGEAKEAKKAAGYHCPMHPNFRSDKPGDCGICGMRLVPDEAPEQPAAETAAAGEMPAGAMYISPEKQQLIGVTYGAAEYTTSTGSFRATGKVVIDETRVVKVQTRIEGWIEQVFANVTGDPVKKGDPLVTIYSPEMLATQQELLLALKSREVMKGSALESGKEHGESLVAAARKRLELWDLSAEQIARIEKTGQPIRNVTVYAPASGHVMTRNAYPKQRVTAETELYTLADLSRVWIIADVFENEASNVRIGSAATITLTYAGGRRIGGRVTHIHPQLEAATRTLQVRLEADNPRLVMKPEMFVDVEFPVGGGRRLTVPATAVLDTGLRQTVFVDLGGGHIEPRQVRTGERLGDRVEIVSGLKEGERVATSGNFLLDSETQLRGNAAGSGAGAAPAPAVPAGEAGRHGPGHGR
jgi:RND family efflux transporter MFP subunit